MAWSERDKIRMYKTLSKDGTGCGMAGQEPACESTHTRLGGQASGYKFLMARCRGLKLPRQGSFALGVAPQSSRKRSNDGHQSFGIFTEHVVEILFAKQSHLPVL